MAKLNEVQGIVLELLIDRPTTRGDDYLLIYEVLKKYRCGNYNVDYILVNHAQLGLPSIETITRCRRKLQAKYPELAGKEMRRIRKKEERTFKYYALDNK